MKLSFVIPCYKSESTISIVVQEIIDTVSLHSEYDYEIILVSDSSPDGVYDVIKELSDKNSKIKGIEFSKNFGQHAALMAGYRETTGDIILSLDDDGEISPNEMFKLINRLDETTDVVAGCFPVVKRSFFRQFGTFVHKFMARVMIGIPRDFILNCSFVAYKRYVIDEILKYNNPYPYLAGLVFRTTYRVANVEIEYHSRLTGESGYTMGKLFSLWVNGFTAFSVKPLRMAALLGCICAFSGFCWLLYIVISALVFQKLLAGYASIMAVILFIGGILMLILGVIGEYIGRIYICLNKSPQYVIRRKTF